MFKNKYFYVLILIILLLIIVYSSAVNRENTLVYDNVLGFVTRPMSQLATYTANNISGFFEYFSDKKELIKENTELTSKIAALEYKNAQLESFEAENERLRGMLSLKDKNPSYDLSAATVISKDNSNYYGTFLIDRGTNHGIATNMPVVGAKGTIGYIIEAGTTWSRVKTIIDGGSSVGCTVTRTKNLAVTEGDTALLPDGLLKMIYISKDMNLIEGDMIETSGLGQIYPSGMLIGRVKEIKTDESSQTQYAIVRPVEEFSVIREVFVIKNAQDR